MKKDLLTNFAIIDTDTGELTQYLTQNEKTILDKKYTSVAYKDSKLNDVNSRVSDDLFNMYIKENCGTFYFNYYNNIKCTQYEFRFIYLCTFMNYKNYLEYGNAKEENKLMVKNDLFEVLKLSRMETYNTLNYLLENNLIIFDDCGYLKINDKCSKRGSLDKKSKEITRIFDNAIKEIYENSLPKEHKKLGLLIKLLPFVHYSLNVICSNPYEEKEELINSYSLTDVSKLLGYSTTQKFKKGLMDIKINGEPVIMISKINNKSMIVINPKIYYKGGKSNFDKMQGIISLFSISK